MELTFILFGFFSSILTSLYQQSILREYEKYHRTYLSIVFYAVCNGIFCNFFPTTYCVLSLVVLVLTQYIATSWLPKVYNK